MINRYVEDRDYEAPLLLFQEMQVECRGDKVTMASLLLASTHFGLLSLLNGCMSTLRRRKSRRMLN